MKYIIFLLILFSNLLLHAESTRPFCQATAYCQRYGDMALFFFQIHNPTETVFFVYGDYDSTRDQISEIRGKSPSCAIHVYCDFKLYIAGGDARQIENPIRYDVMTKHSWCAIVPDSWGSPPVNIFFSFPRGVAIQLLNKQQESKASLEIQAIMPVYSIIGNHVPVQPIMEVMLPRVIIRLDPSKLSGLDPEWPDSSFPFEYPVPQVYDLDD